jgi:hypothetical protein
MCDKKDRSGGINMGSQNFRAIAAKTMIVNKGRGVNASHLTGCSWRVTYPSIRTSNTDIVKEDIGSHKWLPVFQKATIWELKIPIIGILGCVTSRKVVRKM